MTNDEAWALLLDPATEPAVLAEIAYEHPQLRPSVASHARAYPQLQAWIVEVGALPPAPVQAAATQPSDGATPGAAVVPAAALLGAPAPQAHILTDDAAMAQASVPPQTAAAVPQPAPRTGYPGALADRPSVTPDTRRRPRYILGTFWMIVAVLLFFASFSGGHWWLIVFAIAAVAYSIYLYRGGRFGVWFI